MCSSVVRKSGHEVRYTLYMYICTPGNAFLEVQQISGIQFYLNSWKYKKTSTVSCLFLHGNYTYIQQLDEVKPDGSLNEALRQVGLADVILINKTDLVTTEQLAAIRQRIRSWEINDGHGLPEALHEP